MFQINTEFGLKLKLYNNFLGDTIIKILFLKIKKCIEYYEETE